MTEDVVVLAVRRKLIDVAQRQKTITYGKQADEAEKARLKAQYKRIASVLLWACAVFSLVVTVVFTISNAVGQEPGVALYYGAWGLMWTGIWTTLAVAVKR